MRERLARLRGRVGRPRRPLLLAVGAVVGFVAVVGAQLHPPDPESRLPGSQRLAALIQRQQHDNEQQRAQVQGLRSQIDASAQVQQAERAGAEQTTGRLASAGTAAGTVAVKGTGFTVTLDDSSLASSPTGNVNDLVIHSQDVQAVVNGLWAAGAEAIAINGQRLVSTSAILCVGNTLLLNGTVHSPPYEISGIGADHDEFLADPLVRQLRADAEHYSLRFSVGREQTISLPAYAGPVSPKYARPAG